MIVDYVEDCNTRYLDMETDAARVEALGRQEDPRVVRACRGLEGAARTVG